MKFIHTSDWHIGRQFHNVSLLDDQRHILEQIVAHIKNEAVDAVIIAGDIYDRSVPPAAAVSLLDEVLNTICTELGVPVLLIPGNHDGAERLRFGSKQLSQAGLHIIGDLDQITQPVILTKNGCEISFYGIPYNDPESVRNHFSAEVSSHDEAHQFLIEQINAVKTTDSLNVLISHCFIDGAEASESERPLSIGGADRVCVDPFKTFDYVALGHLHNPQHKGETHIRYSGSILKYSFSEQHHQKGVTLVELNPSGFQKTTHLPLVPLRDMRTLEGDLETLLQQGATDPHNQDYLLIRLTDQTALLEPMSKLRQVYENVLHIEKTWLQDSGTLQVNRDKLKRGELEMFQDFFKQVSGNDLTADQQAAIQQIITNTVNSQEGGLA